MDREYLTLEHIEKSFGGNRALKDVSFSVKKGTVHFLFVFVNKSIDGKIIR